MTLPPNPLGYPEATWRLFRTTPRAGRLPEPCLHVEAQTPAAPFRLRVDVQVQHGRVIDARFQALGCPYTIATGAWLAGWLVGRRIPDEVQPAPLAELREALEIPEDRAHCGLMAQDLLRDLFRRCP